MYVNAPKGLSVHKRFTAGSADAAAIVNLRCKILELLSRRCCSSKKTPMLDQLLCWTHINLYKCHHSTQRIARAILLALQM
jgi:hypothetical protein